MPMEVGNPMSSVKSSLCTPQGSRCGSLRGLGTSASRSGRPGAIRPGLAHRGSGRQRGAAGRQAPYAILLWRPDRCTLGPTAALGQGRPLTLGAFAPNVTLQSPLAPGGTVVGPAWPSERPKGSKMLDPTMDAPDAGTAPSGKCQRGSPVSASYASADDVVVDGAKTTPLL